MTGTALRSDQRRQVLQYQEHESLMVELSRATGLSSARRAGEMLDRLVPIVFEAMGLAGRSPVESKGLLASARGFSWVERENPEALFGNTPLGHDLAQVAFADSFSALVASIAAEEDLSEANVGALLEIISQVSLAVIAGPPNGRLSAEEFAATLELNVAHPAADASHTPVHDASQGPTAAPGTLRPIRPADRDNGRRVKLTLFAVALVASGVIGFTVAQTGPGEAVEVAALDSAVEAPAVVSTSVVSTSVVSTEPAAEEPAVEEIAVTEPVTAEPVTTESVVAEPVLELNVLLRNAVGADSATAGELRLTLDTVTGEVCYDATSVNVAGPYRAHIHVGGEGVNGAVVSHLIATTNATTGCVASAPADTNAMLADPAGHYVELSNADRTQTVRGQLATAEG